MTNGKRSFSVTIPWEYDGASVLKVLKEQLKLSGTLIKRLKHTDGILLNGHSVRTVDSVAAGDCLTAVLSERIGSDHVLPVYSPIHIVYEDADLLVVNKPAGMAVHSSRKSDPYSLANALAYYFQQKEEYHIFRAVNRLDRQTSGLMIVAKHEHSNALLVQSLKRREIEKEYLAITDGLLPDKEGTFAFPIKRAEGSVLKRVVAQDGKEAITHYKTVKEQDNMALVQIRLETGRTHQIRVHFAHVGCPLLGDWLYGREQGVPIKRHALHAWKLTFAHPITGQQLRLEAPLPEDMETLFG